jgi:non-specific protein-tyrosine kinase
VSAREPAFAEREGAARYLQALREHWLLIALLVVVAVGAAAAYALTAEKRYEAGVDVLVLPVQGDDETFIGIPVLRESGVQARSVLTAARLIETPQVAELVKEELNLSRTPRGLLASIEATPLEQSSIVNVKAESGSAEGAANLANAFAGALIEQQTEQFQAALASVVERLEALLAATPADARARGESVAIEQRLAELKPLLGAPDPTLRIASAAVPPEQQSWPRPVLSVAVALVAALLLGFGAALALSLLNPRVNREDELLLGHRLPILTRVPRMRRDTVRAYLTEGEPLPGDVREAYRTLRASIATAGPEGDFPRTILVTSASPAEGKTMTSVNLAITIAQAGSQVILVDGDLRRPMVASVFGLPVRQHGFASLLVGETTPEAALVPAPGHRGLRLLPASPEQAHLVDLLDPRRVESALAELRQLADVIVIDSPPLTEVADALPLAEAAEAVLVAVRLGRTRRDRLTELRRVFARRGIAPLGFVVTLRRRSRRGGVYYGSEPRDKRRDAAENGDREPVGAGAEHEDF